MDKETAKQILDTLEATREWMRDCLCDKQQRGTPSREAYERVADTIKKAKQAKAEN